MKENTWAYSPPEILKRARFCATTTGRYWTTRRVNDDTMRTVTRKIIVYMYKIEGSTVHWIDAVVPCSCYPNKKLKGRLLNCDRLHPNVIAKTKFLNERPHVHLYAKRNIKKREELMFDYGCFKDRFSSQQSWM